MLLGRLHVIAGSACKDGLVRSKECLLLLERVRAVDERRATRPGAVKAARREREGVLG